MKQTTFTAAYHKPRLTVIAAAREANLIVVSFSFMFTLGLSQGCAPRCGSSPYRPSGSR